MAFFEDVWALAQADPRMLIGAVLIVASMPLGRLVHQIPGGPRNKALITGLLLGWAGILLCSGAAYDGNASLLLLPLLVACCSGLAMLADHFLVRPFISARKSV